MVLLKMHNITFSTVDSFSINAPYFLMIYDYTEHQLWRISCDKASNFPKRDDRFILLK